MLPKICSWLSHSENKVAPLISLKEIFGADFDFLSENYLNSLDDFAQRIVLGELIYEQTSIEKNSIFFIECDTFEPKEFQMSEARLWKFDEQKFIGEISKLLNLDSTAIRLGDYTDGYCLGTLQLDHKYAIFLCFNEVNFPLSALGYLRDGIRPILIRISCAPIPEITKIFILEHGGVECHITDLFSLSNRGMVGGDLKSLLAFKGTRQKQHFNLEDLKNAMKHKNIADLCVTIIEGYKINFRVKNVPFSLTLKYSDIPDFYNSRIKDVKESWNALCRFASSKNENGLRYTADLKNRLKELRLFFKKIKNVEAFEVFSERNFCQIKDGRKRTQDSHLKHRSRGVKETFVRPLFEIKSITNEYEVNSDKY